MSLQSYTLKNSALAPGDHVNGIELLAGFTYSGTESMGNPKVIEFALEISRTERRANKSSIPDLTAEIEGQQINLGKPVLLGSANENIKDDVKGIGTVRFSNFTEKFGVLIPVDVFKKLAAAKVVKLETGDVKVTLRDKQLEALRDLASRIE